MELCERQRIRAHAHISAKPDSQQAVNSTSLGQPSVIDELYQQGSARIRFPHTQPGALQAVLLNTAGGLTGDDDLHWRATAKKQSHVCISTAACEKIYRTHGPAARQQTTLQVDAKARLEWLPQESILFNGSSLERVMRVDLEAQAEALIVESFVLGRQAMHEPTNNIKIHDRWRIFRNSQLLHAEDFRLDMTTGIDAQRSCILHHYSAISTMVFVNNQSGEWCDMMVDSLRSLANDHTGNVRVGVSALPCRLVVRVMAINSYHLRKFLIPCIELLNDGRPIPAVWNV